MKYLLIASLLFTATMVSANAQELTIKVTPPEADMIWKGLRKLPVEEVEAFMGKMRQQIMDQTKAAEVPKPTAEPKKE